MLPTKRPEIDVFDTGVSLHELNMMAIAEMAKNNFFILSIILTLYYPTTYAGCGAVVGAHH